MVVLFALLTLTACRPAAPPPEYPPQEPPELRVVVPLEQFSTLGSHRLQRLSSVSTSIEIESRNMPSMT